MGNRLGQPDPHPEGLLAHARKIAKLARRADDTVNSGFLIDKTEEQYTFAINAFDSRYQTQEATEARAELEQFRTESGFIASAAPLLSERSGFRRALDSLAASKEVGQFFNGIDDVNDIVALARSRMANRDRLSAAEDATRAATCMLWRAHREEETIVLYNEFTDALVKEINASIRERNLVLVEARCKIARKRLLLTDRKEEARQLLQTVTAALEPAV